MEGTTMCRPNHMDVVFVTGILLSLTRARCQPPRHQWAAEYNSTLANIPIEKWNLVLPH